MKNDRFQKAKNIFQKRHGILRRVEAIKLGVPEYVIYEMTKSGDLIKEARGLYKLAESEPLSNPDLVQASLLIPKGVVFLISALYFHRLTTQIPHWIYLALPRGTSSPKVEYPPVKAFIRSEKQYSAGVEEHTIDGIKVRIYSRKKLLPIVSNIEKKSKRYCPGSIEGLYVKRLPQRERTHGICQNQPC
ncbi:MAG: type IV toxin-antitoxin system AbiEi family antitoxin domain-containing protein [Anaerolineales bacterium]|uniref:type IV toxin-antitoxin system AbiEi family antitoxin domain-containing protein n=1 Tax=Candidatus Villigracilis proximus TaxID=3140683 RepID=UPI0031372337|nr:type IV toxin-antitoxin system AbiEi family antitoxin domain-containing protein [Anaerolineales bacterium]